MQVGKGLIAVPNGLIEIPCCRTTFERRLVYVVNMALSNQQFSADFDPLSAEGQAIASNTGHPIYGTQKSKERYRFSRSDSCEMLSRLAFSGQFNARCELALEFRSVSIQILSSEFRLRGNSLRRVKLVHHLF